ncbi:hypothetical protein FA10DRAFT_302713 [Acaromyces ingoldii]|uniref:Uncharacterized protein n=1 Tax=Acaromyces ingoldii TaxID=215250 RepID=A0A316YKM8_9BASI|nr:hypothetical protein FA10DRAFT_302713 [Acaromyces ingoldii]PWN89364.1 hypothetical protein FA10DRAFT_302713 [Acaromyces ingoldii]
MDDVTPETAARYRQAEVQLQFSQLGLPGNCPSGVYLAPTEHDDELSGVLFVHRGYYAGAVLRFRLVLPLAFPSRAPLVFFEGNHLIHPLVDARNSRMLIAAGFPSWDPRRDSLSRLLWFIKGAFKRFELDKLSDGVVANEESWRLYRSNRPLFAKLASQCATVSSNQSTLFGRHVDGHELGSEAEAQRQTSKEAIAFSKVEDQDMARMRRQIFQEGYH